MTRRIWSQTLMVTTLAMLVGCNAEPTTRTIPREMELAMSETAVGVGAGQGVEVHGGWVWLYGDAETGVIRRCEFVQSDGRPHLRYSGAEIKLTRDGDDLISRPSGLTVHPEHGCFIGSADGVIYKIDLARALADGDLDNAVLAEIDDDLAVDGSRPEFVRYRGDWYVATADAGPRDNQVRLYDPSALARAERTSELPVLRKLYRCGPWVQNLQWFDDEQVLVLVQNTAEGLGYRLTPVTLEGPGDLRAFEPVDLHRPQGRLEGFAPLEDRWCMLLSSGGADNVWFGRCALRPAAEAQR
jgi:hypothetical protein